VSDAGNRDDYVGAVVVVGISFVTKDGGERRQQYAGTIDRFQGEGEDEAVILLCHDAVERAFPWDSENLSDVEPGNYRLNDEGTVVRDPDYVMQFVVHEDSE
jgi:ribosomal protein L19